MQEQRIKPEEKKTSMTILREYITIFLVLAPFALIVNWVFIPHAVVGGGLTGLCSVIYYVTSGMFPDLFASTGGAIPVWLTTLVINSILLLIAVFTVGFEFCLRTLWGVLSLSFWYWLIPIRSIPLIEDPLLGGIIGGVIFGASLALVLLNNGSSGGTDIVAWIVHYYWNKISIGKVMLFCDVVIILSAYILPVPDSVASETAEVISDYRLKRVLYGVSLTVTYSATIDWIISHSKQYIQMFIYSHSYGEIASAINTCVNRGVTVLDGHGWYSQQPMKVISVIAKKQESPEILRVVNDIDPNAIISESIVTGAYGTGFDMIRRG